MPNEILDSMPYIVGLLVVWGSVATAIVAFIRIGRLAVPVARGIGTIIIVAGMDSRDVEHVMDNFPDLVAWMGRIESKIDDHINEHDT